MIFLDHDQPKMTDHQSAKSTISHRHCRKSFQHLHRYSNYWVTSFTLQWPCPVSEQFSHYEFKIKLSSTSKHLTIKTDSQSLCHQLETAGSVSLMTV